MKTDALTAGADPNNFASFDDFLFNKYGEHITQEMYDAMMLNFSKLGTTSWATLGNEGTECVSRECIDLDNAFALENLQAMPEFLKCGFTNHPPSYL